MKQKLVGGQAVIEGVMMRCGNKVATAVRKDKKIKIKKETFSSIADTYRFLKWPFFRGIVNLVELLVIGIKTLEYSAHEAAGEDEQLSRGILTLMIIFALAFGIFLFVFLPYLFTYVIGLEEQTQPFLFNVVDGVIKLLVLVVYIVSIGLLKDIRVLFQYHGAEHKAVACYEHSKPLTSKHAQRFSKAHTRCGTTFLLFVILVGIVLFSFIPPILFSVFPNLISLAAPLRYLILFMARILVLPIVAGVAYEFLRLSARFPESAWVKPLILPGMLVQRLTTREPNAQQIEVALAALKAVV